jgi:hypothetical protein
MTNATEDIVLHVSAADRQKSSKHTERWLRARIYRLFEQLMIKALPSARADGPGCLCTTVGAGNIWICRE